ncbi:MAG: hypothetical protein EXS27_02500 [Pedosphaera sp.]|nr:hypothetical protein [Pedosphaera sp.]
MHRGNALPRPLSRTLAGLHRRRGEGRLQLTGPGGPINTPPRRAKRVIHGTDCQGFVGASSLDRMGVEALLTNLTKEFKHLKLPKATLKPNPRGR